MSASFEISDKKKWTIASFFQEIVVRVWPTQIKANVFFYLLLAPILLCISLGIATLYPVSYSNVLPFIGLMGLVLSITFRTIGISIAYAVMALGICFFFQEIPENARLLTFGIYFSLALEFYIALLCVEEAEALLQKVQDDLKSKIKQIHVLNSASKEEQQSFDTLRKELEAEIEKWKEEAESRRIEKRMDDEKLVLLDSELKHFSAQKQGFIQDAFEARKEAEQRKLRLEKTLAMLEEKEQEIKEERRLRGSPEKQMPMTGDEVDASLKRELAKKEGVYKQLRSQFDEKCKTLDLTRKEFFKTETALLALKKKEEVEGGQIAAVEIAILQENLASLLTEKQNLESEVLNLEELVSHILSL